MTKKIKMKDVIGSLDAYLWAELFVQMVKKNPDIAKDIDTMATWFACTICAGQDSEIWKQKFKEAGVENFDEYLATIL